MTSRILFVLGLLALHSSPTLYCHTSLCFAFPVNAAPAMRSSGGFSSNRQTVAASTRGKSRVRRSGGNYGDGVDVRDESGSGIFSARPHIVFPGGGIFFYWQAGAVTHLRESGYDLGNVSFAGASAGALTATLSATGVDFGQATDLALGLAAEAGVWDRRAGLQGIWGPMIRRWLDELIPENAMDRVGDQRLSLLVTPVPSFRKERVQTFHSREDLIDCCLASVHIPWFLDGQLFTMYRDVPCIDGSFLAQERHYVPDRSQDAFVLNYLDDPAYRTGGVLDFIEAVSPQGIYRIVDDGKQFARRLEEQGAFRILPKRK